MTIKTKRNIFKLLSFIFGAAIITSSYYIGELLSYLIVGFISPAVLGMIVLFGLLKVGAVKSKWIEAMSNFLLDNLMLFFIPATAGVALVPFITMKDQAAAIIISVLLSSLLVLWIVGFIIDKFEAKKKN